MGPTALPTNFERHGLTTGSAPSVSGRRCVITIDFEAFSARNFAVWAPAMEVWSSLAASTSLPMDVFLSVEDAVALRHDSPGDYATFVQLMQRMAAAGITYHPHNHRVFDTVTGHVLTDPADHTKWVAGYANQASMFYDVCRRHQRDLSTWIETLTASFDSILDDAALPAVSPRVFRAGGFDSGSSDADQTQYLEALSDSGYRIDSSATAGSFDAKDLRVGAPFGRNVFDLRHGIVEIAPCWALDCGSAASPAKVRALLRLLMQTSVWRDRSAPGVFVVLLHFDHLFHQRQSGRYDLFAIRDQDTITRRIHATFALLQKVCDTLRLEPATFAEVLCGRAAEVGSPAPQPI